MSAEAVERPSFLMPDEVTRPLVPTERQLAADPTAFAAHEFLQASPVVRLARPSMLARFKAYLAGINPLAVEGSPLPLLVCALSAFAVGWDVAAATITAPEIQAEFGLSVAALAAGGSFVGTLSVLGAVPMGYLADRVSRIWIIRSSKAGFALAQFAQAFAPSFGLLNAAKLAGGLSIIPGVGAQYPFLADSYPSRSRARVFSTLAFGTTLGGVLAPPIVGFITNQYGWRAATASIAVLTGVVALLTFLLREPVRGGFDRLELGLSAELAAKEEAPPRFGEALRGAWGIKTLRLVAMATAVFGFTGVLGIIDASVQATKFGLDPQQRSFLLTLSSLILLPTLAAGSGIADRLLVRKPSTLVSIQAAASFVTAAAYVGTAFAPNLIVYVALNLVPLVVIGLLTPAANTVLSLVSPARYRGMAQQIGTPFTLATMLIGPALLNTVTGTGNLQQVYLYFAPFSLVAGFIYLAAAGSVANDMRTAKAAAAANEASERARREQADKILLCRDVDVTIDDVQVLFRIDLDVRAGEIVALVGTNGAGKSTLLRAICGLQTATNGAIYFDGRDVTYLATHESARMGIVYMPGGQGVFPLLSVRENLATASLLTEDAAERAAGLERVLEFFPRLRERIDTQAGSMSGGEQQMLALGQAFLMKPRLLMIDELSLGLAPAVVEQLLGAIRGMKDEGITVMLVEQSINVALTVADRAVFMEKGEIRFDGSTEDLLARPDLIRSVFMGGVGSGGSAPAARARRPLGESEKRDLLNCEGLTIAYGGLKVLNGVSLQVGAGEVVGIIGPNGAGKTTLFDLLSGYTHQDGGTVHLDDVDITAMGPDARARLGLGRAFQNARLFPPLTVRENITVALEKRASKSPLLGAVWAPSVQRSERKLRIRADGFIELLGLTSYADKFVRELSTGTRRAVEVACQMAAEPKVLLLDEPSSGLAQAETEALGPALLRIVKETGCGMLVIEHDLPLITSISDRLIAMELGTVVTTGTPSEVTTDPRVLASYLAASADVIERSGSRVGALLADLADAR